MVRRHFMKTQITEALTKAVKESKLWALAAWTLPFVALAILTIEHYIGSSQLIHITIIIVTAIFFAVSVFWWWWALGKIVVIMESMKHNEDRFQQVKDELRLTRKVIQEQIDVDNRKR